MRERQRIEPVRSVYDKKIPERQFFQPSVKIGDSEDFHEKEADTVADKIMRMPTQTGSFFSPVSEKQATSISRMEVSDKNISRKCSACEDEHEIQRKEKESDTSSVEAPNTVSEALNFGGQPMDATTQEFMGSRFGYDFSNVRIHTGDLAAKSAQSINALAYTSGSSIVFNEGQYSTGTESGKKLLAHELTHVVQQNSSLRQKTVQRAPLTSPRLAGNTSFDDTLKNKKMFKLGDSGPEVRRIQQLLIDLGFDLSTEGASGAYNLETTNAVKAFQKSRVPPLVDDGIVGFKTIAALDTAFPSFTLPPDKSSPWTMSCILKILCPWNKNLVQKILPTFNIVTFDSREFPTETWDGGKWVSGKFVSGGFTQGKNLGFSNTSTCERFALTVYHEGWHAQQPDTMTGVVDAEKDAYINTEQWSIAAGIPGQTFTNKTTSKKEGLRKTSGSEVVADETAAETLVKQNYGGVSSTPSERIISRVGANQVKVLKPDGSEIVRQANAGESVRGAVNMTNLKKIDPKDWVCT